MKNTIENNIELIKESVDWVNSSLSGGKRKEAYYRFVNFRRALNKRRFALEENPAAALYGESQMGKSYLVSSLLSEEGRPFSVVDGQGKEYDFINQINPIGKGTESTSLVTRFSSKYQWIKSEYPLKAKLLSPVDIVLVLCDTYYNDVKAKADTIMRTEEIESKLTFFQAQFADSQPQQFFIIEDDILDIKDYFAENLPTKTINILDAEYFEKISLLISFIQPVNWSSVFSILWNDNEYLTKLFSRLILQYEKLGFTDAVYLPMEAVLRDYGTLLDVTRLHDIYEGHSGSEPYFKSDTSLFYIDAKGEETLIPSFSKSYLCALSAELVFRLPNELEYNKPFLKNTDLLDFPGARHRLGIHEDDINDKLVPQMLLRGKVAYLFNKYSDSYRINTLLFCHSNKQSAQSSMPEMLNKWIEKMVGDTPEKRKYFRSPIPPLFVVSTMFNIDLQYDFNNDRKGNRNYLDNRWERRFQKVLEKEIFGVETFSWLDKWSTEQPYFRNIYLLRDFFYSSDTESKIYKGYNESKKEESEIKPDAYTDFRDDLRQSFIEYDFVKRHFDDPAESWDRAASCNEDGSQLIIDKLTIAADNINDARKEQFRQELNAMLQEIVSELKKYFNDSDSDKMLQKAKETAGEIQRKLDIVFGADDSFFGNMMSQFMITQSGIYDLFHSRIHDIEAAEKINMEKYIGIRINTPDLNPEDKFEVNLERLRIKYEKETTEECQASFEADGIDLEELFYGNKDRIKKSSEKLAEALENYWFENVLKDGFSTNLSSILSESLTEDMLAMMRKLYAKLNITKKIAEKIRRYVDSFYNEVTALEMIADIGAEMVNKFANTVGYYYFDESDIESLKQANSARNLGLILNHEELEFGDFNREEVVSLLQEVDQLLDQIQSNNYANVTRNLPLFSNYKRWYDLLKVGFVHVNDIPDYNVEANNKLRKIIDRSSSIQY